METPLKYPSFNIGMESKLHPEFTSIEYEVNRWAIKFKLYENGDDEKQYMHEELIRLACMAFPSGDFDRTVMVSKFMVHAFVLDDEILKGKEGPFFKSLIGHDNSLTNIATILDNASQDDVTPVAISFNDYWKDMKAVTDEAWQSRFSANFVWYLKANEWERKNNEQYRFPPLAEYTEYRHFSLCADASLNLIELSRSLFLPDSLLANPVLRRITDIVGDFTAFENDLFSFEKEMKAGEVNNVVLVLKHQNNISYQEAIDKGSVLVNESLEKFFTLEKQYPSFDGYRGYLAKAYLEGLREWIAGTHYWTLISKRYLRNCNNNYNYNH